ncbi:MULTISPECIES: GntP family permease [Cytobacillus]|uniref:GntP family permease n=1 Tax=Cytobacillus TaxID=2675230 RepID=UPI00204267B0|nr:SLC13 family permease [Cytobacillus kochii]MCM3323321.1 GntP family permease [Cytobacillus kochii]MCM3345716.1 GntP family permease [Cytobacillus kochii]MDM5206378.1 GntP family permease [Cytobacillus kochii]
MLSMIGLIGGLVLLTVLVMRGMNLLIVAPLSALFVAVLNGVPLFPQFAGKDEVDFITGYMDGFAGFITSWYLMFLAGAIFGKVMEDSGAAESVSHWIVTKIGMKHAVLAVVLSCAVLTYGGVSLFVVAFAVYPMAVSLFKEADLPRRFIPAALAFGSTTFTMTSAGSPEIQNWIPIPYLGTNPYAGWEVSIITAIFMLIFGYWLLMKVIRRAVRKGEKFVGRDTDNNEIRSELPHPLLSLIPLLVVLIVAFVFHDSLAQSALILALTGGVIATWLLNRKYFRNFWEAVGEGTMGALIAIGNTAAVVGFGGVAKITPAFSSAVDFMTSIPGSPLIGGALSVMVIAGLTGSSSGGQTIALPILAPHYLDMGVNAEALHRTVSLSSGTLDSLPHGGYAVTTIRSIAGETHKDAYPAFGLMTVVVPIAAVVLAVILFSFGVGV